MIEKFKTNAEVIENGDKYLYGNHVRMPISMERGEGVYVFDKDGNKYFAHTLNNTVVAPPRMLIAFLENNLNEDGSVRIPEPLQRYMFTDCIRP